MKPALTPEQWKNPAAVFPGDVDVAFHGPGEAHGQQRETFALAALLLQRSGPDGGPLFTWEDVDALRETYMPTLDFDWSALADRIASLLPPRDL